VSNHKEAVFDTFGIKTLDFGVKPVGFDKVSEWLTVALTEYRTNTVICFEKDKPSINITDILYIKAEGNYIDVVTKVNSFIYIGHLKDWEDRLDMCNIIRVHKSYIVNLEHIKELRSNIILDNGKEISVGRSYRNLIKKRFKCYNNNYVGLNNGYLCEVIQ
jgi:DNA-binding LytR/AlgR family response regulator